MICKFGILGFDYISKRGDFFDDDGVVVGHGADIWSIVKWKQGEQVWHWADSFTNVDLGEISNYMGEGWVGFIVSVDMMLEI